MFSIEFYWLMAISNFVHIKITLTYLIKYSRNVLSLWIKMGWMYSFFYQNLKLRHKPPSSFLNLYTFTQPYKKMSSQVSNFVDALEVFSPNNIWRMIWHITCDIWYMTYRQWSAHTLEIEQLKLSSSTTD